MKKSVWISLLVIIIIGCFAVNAFTDFYVIPSTKEVVTEVVEYVYTSISRTGQTTSYATGDDGDWEAGGAWPSPRFTDNEDGTITDNLTGLIWLEDANEMGAENWATAISDCNSLQNGQHGISDGSSPGDWRLPNINELQSLIDYGQNEPTLPSGHPFLDVMATAYWTSTTYMEVTLNAYVVTFYHGDTYDDGKSSYNYIWPVRNDISSE